MIQIVYVSAANQGFPSEGLHTLLEKARIRNALYGVTGLLLYHSGSFLQVLEGPESRVNRLFASIAHDPRHRNVRLLLSAAIVRREFEAWPMAFVDISEWPKAAPGAGQVRRDLPLPGAAPTEAGRYIRVFQDSLCRQAVRA